MKRFMNIFLVFIIVFMISGCKEAEHTHLTVLVPSGKMRLVQFAMEATYPIIGDDSSYEISAVGSDEALQIAVENEVYDIVYAPLNYGALNYNDSGSYELAATIIFGDTYLFTRNPAITDWEDLEGQVIYTYNSDSLDSIILEILIEQQEYETPPTITYLETIHDVLNKTDEAEYSIVVLEEPFLYSVTSDGNSYNTISFQDEWVVETGFNYPEYGLFVKDDVKSALIDSYLIELELSIMELEENTSDVVELTGDMQLVLFPSDFEDTLSNGEIIFTDGTDSKDMVVEYFEYIKQYNEELIGVEIPGNDFYN